MKRISTNLHIKKQKTLFYAPLNTLSALANVTVIVTLALVA